MTVIKQYTGGNWEAILVGEQGPVGPAGPGVPTGGATGDLLVKNSGTNYDTAWSDAPTVDSITLDTTAAETLAAVGQTVWDDTAGSAATLLKGGNVTAVMGQTIYQRVVNETGSPLTKGQVVYLTGASGQKVTVALAQADGDPTSSKTFGVVAETIAHSAQGFVMTEGLLQGFATNLLTEGAIVWLSPTTPGGMTTTKPTAPDHVVMVGICVKSGSGTSGSILVKVQNGYELDELHDVAYTGTPATGDVLTRTAGGLWTNAAPAASGAPVGAQYVTLATDGTLTSERVLTAGTGITVTDGGAGAAVTVATSAILPTIIDAKGDLIVGTANDTAARLAVGTSNGQVLTVDSSQSSGMVWSTPTISVAQVDGNTMHVNENGYTRLTFTPSTIGLTPSTLSFVEFELTGILQAGTYSLVTSGNKANNRGIATIRLSSDGTTWSTLTTVDQYAVAQAWVTNIVTGLTIGTGMKFLRVETPTKNVSSSNFQVYLAGIGLRRTGA